MKVHGKPKITAVAPVMGAWIETQTSKHTARTGPVAPVMGAWIETNK